MSCRTRHNSTRINNLFVIDGFANSGLVGNNANTVVAVTVETEGRIGRDKIEHNVAGNVGGCNRFFGCHLLAYVFIDWSNNDGISGIKT